jgi:hypothetical protein
VFTVEYSCMSLNAGSSCSTGQVPTWEFWNLPHGTGKSSGNESKNQQYGLANANPDGLEQAFRDAPDFCVSHEGH